MPCGGSALFPSIDKIQNCDELQHGNFRFGGCACGAKAEGRAFVDKGAEELLCTSILAESPAKAAGPTENNERHAAGLLSCNHKVRQRVSVRCECGTGLYMGFIR